MSLQRHAKRSAESLVRPAKQLPSLGLRRVAPLQTSWRLTLLTNGVSLLHTKYHVSILQTKFSDREGHKARRVGLQTVPLDQHIEGGHGEREPRLKIRPAPMHHLLHMADQRQHGEHRLHQHAVLALAARTEFQIAGIPFRGME